MLKRFPLPPSAFDVLGAGVTPAMVLDFHRATFGTARMDENEGQSGQSAGESGAGEAGQGGQQQSDRGYPANTPVADMTDAQQAAYWKAQSRRHEDAAKSRKDYDTIKAENEKLKAATLTESEKAIEAARNEGKTAGAQEASAKLLARIVTAEIKAAFKGARTDEQIAPLLAAINPTYFLAENGEDIDADKVTNYVAGLAPAGSNGTNKWPDMGAGKRGPSTQAKGVAAGADLYAASRGKKPTT